jgi:predicted dehydrogenase
MPDRKRYAIVGTGGRIIFYVDGIAGEYRDYCQLVGFCDISPTRMGYWNNHLAEKFKHPPLPQYVAKDFDKMIAEQKPDIVIVTTMDSLHHQYTVRAMELGCDVICEKPMTIDAPKARAIFDAIARTGQRIRIGHNYRYAPVCTTMRQVVASGAIGTPLAVDFSWMLDTSHGADYFRRWHRQKVNSGGLLVHKASHHFDLINWWIDSYPELVFCLGELKFYGKKNANARGEFYSYTRYTGEPAAKNDPFALFLDTYPSSKALYLDAEKDSGYIRDRNVFNDDITIEDTMAITARYRSGVILNYSLVAYSPWEGFKAAITGTKGRVELYVRHGSHIIIGQSDDEIAASQARGAEEKITLFRMFGLPRDVEIPKAEGAHGGGDPLMFHEIFHPNPPPDPFKRAASHIDGAAAILMGIAANQSMATGLPVKVDELLKLPEKK